MLTILLQAIVGINQWVLHHDPLVYGPDPDVFRPERWIGSSANQPKNMEYCFMTFRHGTRACLGRNTLTLEMMELVPEHVRRYNFEILEQKMQLTNHWFVKPGMCTPI